MSTGRAIINLIGNGVATVVMAKWEKGLDHDLAKAVLDGTKQANLDTVVK